MQPASVVAIATWVMLVAATGFLVWKHHNRFAALILIGIIGTDRLGGLRLLLGARPCDDADLGRGGHRRPDAPRAELPAATRTPKESSAGRRLRDGVIACAGGLGAGSLAYFLMLRDFVATPISAYHLENSYAGGGGTNVVNVILVDFRGFDTFGEIIVLGIAALVIFALTEALLDGPVRARLLNRTPNERAGGRPRIRS